LTVPMTVGNLKEEREREREREKRERDELIINK
jgi:hypothetical protein